MSNRPVVFVVIHTDQLWVKNELRVQGIGKQLMEKIHEYGKGIGCQISTVATMSFQAKKFYEFIRICS
jgi:GNAT superfamily N-acetyltransferase